MSIHRDAFGTNFLTVIWNEPANTTVDLYRVSIVPDDSKVGTVTKAKYVKSIVLLVSIFV